MSRSSDLSDPSEEEEFELCDLEIYSGSYPEFPKGRALFGRSSWGFNQPVVVLWCKCGFFRR